MVVSDQLCLWSGARFGSNLHSVWQQYLRHFGSKPLESICVSIGSICALTSNICISIGSICAATGDLHAFGSKARLISFLNPAPASVGWYLLWH
jgi:hypothetical protein